MTPMLGGRLAGVIGHFYDLRLRHATTNFKNTIGNPFFERPFLRQNAQKKSLEQKLYRTLFKNCFRKQFWTSGSAQTRKRMKVKVQVL